MSRHSESRRLRLWPVGGIAFALLWAFAGLCQEQNAEQGDPEAAIEAAEAELKRLQSEEVAPPAYKEFRQLMDVVHERRESFEEELGPQRKRIQELSQEESVQEWHRNVSRALLELGRLRSERQNVLQQRGRELHERRQAELADVAVVEAPNARALGFTVLDYPNVDGSTSTQPLGVIVVCKMLGCRYRWAGADAYSGAWRDEEPAVEASVNMPLLDSPSSPASYAWTSFPRNLTLVSYRTIAEPMEPERRDDARQSVIINRMLSNHAGTHEAYENVIKGTSDIALVARAPSGDESDLAQVQGVELEVTPIALDAFVFIKNYENPVTGLSTEQIKSIYSGKVTNWSNVGGRDEGINAYRRDKNSGSQELMDMLVMKDSSYAKLDNWQLENLVHNGMGGPYIALTNDKRGLGYSVYYYEHFMAASPNTELLAVDGVLPSYETIQSGAYPYVTNVYAVVRKGAGVNSRAVEIRDWLLSPEGQAVVRESGYVPLRGAAQG